MKSQKLAKLKAMIFSNIPLKILAVIISFIAWIVITNISDPSKKVTIDNVVVSMKNYSSLSDKGYAHESISGYVSVEVKGPKSVVESLDETDFEAYVDFDDFDMESDKHSVDIKVKCKDKEVSKHIKILTSKNKDNSISVYKKVDKEIPIDIIFSGNLDSGYVVGDYGISRNIVVVSGMDNVVNKIKSASISLDLSTIDEKVSKEIVEKIAIDFYDADGNVVNMNNVETSLKEVTFHMDIFQEKWISVNYTVEGTPAEGYHKLGESPNLTTIKVVAPDFSAGTKIVLPKGTINIDGATDEKEFKLDLKKYLPEGYTITSSIKELVVKVDIEKYISKVIDIPVAKIKIAGLNNNYQYEITTVDNRNVLSVTINGYEDEIGALTLEDINPSIDISNKAPGTYGITVSLTVPEEGTVATTYTVKVVVSEKNVDEPSTTDISEVSITE